MKRLALALLVVMPFGGCDKKPTVPDVNVSVNLSTVADKTIPVDCRLSTCENYIKVNKSDGAGLVAPLRIIIADKDAWAYTPRIAALISKMGTAAVPLRDDLTKKQDNSPNSQNRRWQECLDAIRE